MSVRHAPSVGDLYFDTTLNQLLYWDGTEWVPITGEPDAEGYVKVSGDNMTGTLTIGPHRHLHRHDAAC